MKDYMIGCNYWESRQGIDMWRNFDAAMVEQDFRELSETGVQYIRMFPNWREFQPACTVTQIRNEYEEYRYRDDRKFTNPFCIDEQQIENFKCVCAIAEKYGIGPPGSFDYVKVDRLYQNECIQSNSAALWRYYCMAARIF